MVICDEWPEVHFRCKGSKLRPLRWSCDPWGDGHCHSAGKGTSGEFGWSVSNIYMYNYMCIIIYIYVHTCRYTYVCIWMHYNDLTVMSPQSWLGFGEVSPNGLISASFSWVIINQPVIWCIYCLYGNRQRNWLKPILSYSDDLWNSIFLGLLYIYMHIHTPVHIYVFVSSWYMYICIYTYIYIYTCLYRFQKKEALVHAQRFVQKSVLQHLDQTSPYYDEND